jgi:excisionase family DNA binding protein
VSDNNDDFLSFEKALRELKMRSEELKKLVSEGEIRAFRDGDSMKFRREDVKALGSKAAGDAELSFADSLEDDTGMVTEQISDEDTLLADDEVAAPARGRAAVATPSRPSRAAVAAAAPAKEPGWVAAVGILGFLVMIWGFAICYSISQEIDPKDSPFTSLFAKP